LVPPLLLQPLVENAILHGARASDGRRHVRVSGGIEGGRLRMEVTNAGGLTEARNGEGSGLGLQLTRRRLASAYGDHAELSVAERDGWVTATIRIDQSGSTGAEASP
jgi:LytS/YehU family sensor histidine kinase